MEKTLPTTRFHGRAGRLIVLIGVVSMLGLLQLAVQAWRGHQDAVRAAQARSRDYAGMLQAQLDAALRRTEAVLHSLAHTLPPQALDVRGAERHRTAITRDLALRLRQFPELARVRVFDAAGRSLYRSDEPATLDINIADRDYFAHLRDTADDRLVYSELIHSRTDGEPTMVVARRLQDDAGRFLGVVVAVLQLHHFEQLFQSLDAGPRSAVSVRRTDTHGLVVHWPALPPGGDRVNVQSEVPRRVAAGGMAGTVEVRTPSDGVERLCGFRVLERYPFYVNVCLSRDEVLAGWQRRMAAVGLSTALLLGLLALGLLRLWRSEQRTAQALSATEESEARYRSVVAALAEGIVLNGRDGAIMASNQAAERILGLTREQLQGRTPIDPHWRAVHEDGTPFPGESHPGAYTLRTGQPQRQVVMGVHTPDGRLTWISINSEPIFKPGDGDTPSAVVASFADITDRKLAEQALRDRELLFRTLAQASPVGIFRTDAHGDCTYVNEKHCEIAGLTPETARGRGWMRSLHPDDRDRVHAAWGQAVAQEQPFVAEYRFVRPDGHATWVVGQAQRDAASGDWVGTITDISERRRHETALAELASELEHRVEERTRDLEAAKREAERANRVKSQFLSAMSHELRTPLNAILGFGQLLNVNAAQPLPAPQSDYVQEILNAGRHLLELIGEVLDLASIEAGALQVRLDPVRLQPVVADCMKLVQPAAQARHVRIEAASALQSPGLQVRADRTRLKQVLLNLLSNAVKYNSEGGRVEIGVRTHEGLLRLSVSDTGPGLGPAQQQRLFRDFERLDMQRSSIEGTGVGLALSKRLVELMGGRIGVESREGEGSTFWVDLPEAVAGEALPPEPAPGPGWATPVPPGTEKTVLYIEDDPVNTRLMSALMGGEPGLRLLTARLPGAGLDLAHAERPDLVLLDLQLPGFDGFEVLRQLRTSADTAGIPVIAVSANATPGAIERALAEGFADYVTKPVDAQRLMQAVGQALRRTPGAG